MRPLSPDMRFALTLTLGYIVLTLTLMAQI